VTLDHHSIQNTRRRTLGVIHIRSEEFTSLLTPQGLRAGADSGNPVVHSASRQLDGGNVGIWECEPGGWPVVDRSNTEVCLIQSGTGTITDTETGDEFAVAAGDLVVLPTGWTGRWDLSETLRKVFVTF